MQTSSIDWKAAIAAFDGISVSRNGFNHAKHFYPPENRAAEAAEARLAHAIGPHLLRRLNPTQIASVSIGDPRSDESYRIVMISDTHNRHKEMTHEMPEGDILIHAGDFTSDGGIEQIQDSIRWLQSLKQYRWKVVIAGNHELSIDLLSLKLYNSKRFGLCEKNQVDQYSERIQELLAPLRPSAVAERLKDRPAKSELIYLEDDGVVLENCIEIHGMPWQPEFRDWAFNLNRLQIRKPLSLITDQCDVVVTHGPPLGVGDLISEGLHVGCRQLMV